MLHITRTEIAVSRLIYFTPIISVIFYHNSFSVVRSPKAILTTSCSWISVLNKDLNIGLDCIFYKCKITAGFAVSIYERRFIF